MVEKSPLQRDASFGAKSVHPALNIGLTIVGLPFSPYGF
jgi:hypothetical protein